MKTGNDLVWLGAAELADRIRKGELTALEVVDAFVQRIEEVNGELNAVVVPLYEQARAEAKAADRERARGGRLGPLHGVPMTIKDQFLVKDTPTTLGLGSRAGHRAAADGPLVARLRAAGAIVLGKTNVSQLLVYHESDNPVYGRTNNPWNVERTPGGSSGGEAAIIAAGGSPLGLGGDLGGSIRVPAHFCGVHGLKPTSWRLTNLDTDGHLYAGQESIIPQPGPLARSVADLYLALGVMAAPGLETLDAGVPPAASPDPSKVELRKLRVGVYDDDGFFAAGPAMRRAVRDAAGVLRAAGLDVVEWRPPEVARALELFLAIMSADGGASMRRALAGSKRDRRIAGLMQAAGMPGPLRAVLAGLMGIAGNTMLAKVLRSGGSRSAGSYWHLVDQRNAFRARFLRALDQAGVDVLICPAHALPALTHGSSYYLFPAAIYSVLYNLLGMPAGVVAATRVRPGEESDRAESKDAILHAAKKVEAGCAGLPVGVQVAARHWREDIVLATMGLLEAGLRGRPDYPLRPAA